MSDHEHLYLIGENKSFVEGVSKEQYDSEMAETLKLENKGTAGGVAELGADGKVPEGQIGRGEANGTAPLGADGKVPDDFLPEISGGGILAGTVVAFSGTFSGKNPIPKGGTTPDTGWHICDGTDGTPDLRNKFVYGGNGTNTGTTGGSNTHSHTVTGTVGSHTLTTSEMPSHSHSSLQYGGSTLGSGVPSFVYLTETVPRYSPSTLNTGSKGSGSSHSHTFSSGSANSQSNIPPYYTLAYIIKL